MVDRGAGAKLSESACPPGSSRCLVQPGRLCLLSMRRGTLVQVEPVACRCCVSRLSRGLAIQTNGVVGVVGVESSDYVGQPLRQWVLPAEGKLQRRAGRDLVWFYTDRDPGEGPEGVEEIRESGPRLAPSRAVRNGLPAARNHGRNSLWGSREGGVFAVADRVSDAEGVKVASAAARYAYGEDLGRRMPVVFPQGRR